MTKIDIISGFLGAGKTTLIKKLLQEAYQGEKLVLIENEFGEISIDGGFLKDSGVQISEMSSGCICCSLVGDFGQALQDVHQQFAPDRILIEPSGVGKLSDVVAAVEEVAARTGAMQLNSCVTVADAGKCKMYMKNFGEFYNNQITYAGTIVLSRSQKLSDEKLAAAVELLRSLNTEAAIITTPWDDISGQQILAAMEKVSLAQQLMAEEEICPECGHHHHEHHHGEECGCGHHHDHEHEHHHHHEEECDCGCHHDHHEHHHHHDEDCGCEHHHEHHEHHHHEEDCDCGCHHEHHEHHHHHDHGEECDCGCGHHHDHGHHHHHHADEIFASWGVETPKKFGKSQLEQCLQQLDSGSYGAVLRAKGIVPCEEGGWLQFDYVPEEWQVRSGAADYTGRLCVIGSQLKEQELKKLFGV